MVVNPLTFFEACQFIRDLLILFFFSIPLSYGLVTVGKIVSLVIQSLFVWFPQILSLANVYRLYMQGRASFLDVVWCTAALIWNIVKYVIGCLGWWERLFVYLGITKYTAGGIAAWITFVSGIAFLLWKLWIDIND
ncbi:MAG: hypothetical protein ACTSV7_07765 [Candidatus Baldrarchaeia archaeon]